MLIASSPHCMAGPICWNACDMTTSYFCPYEHPSYESQPDCLLCSSTLVPLLSFRGQWNEWTKRRLLIYLVILVFWNRSRGRQSHTQITPKTLVGSPWQRNNSICYQFKRFPESNFTVCLVSPLVHTGQVGQFTGLDTNLKGSGVQLKDYPSRVPPCNARLHNTHCLEARPLLMMLVGSCSSESSFTVQQHWYVFFGHTLVRRSLL